MGWLPSEFWRATFDDWLNAVWAKRQAANRKTDGDTKRVMQPAEVARMFGALARRSGEGG